jgi:LmbE family N-acetylglucosaminyl deacetylase
MFEVWTPLQRVDLAFDVTPYLERKLDAIRAHASQLERQRLDEAALGLARYRGELHSGHAGLYAEVFERMRLGPPGRIAQRAHWLRARFRRR